MGSSTIQDIPLQRIDGQATTLAQCQGRLLLIVHVPSKCGLTLQYEGLERLYQRLNVAGLDVLGFPCNDFGAQEPGNEAEIVSFCTKNFGEKFPVGRNGRFWGVSRRMSAPTVPSWSR